MAKGTFVAVELESWKREHFTPGGGEPFLFYVVFGQVDFSAPLSRGAYRTNGAPDGLELMSYGPQQGPDVPGSFREGLLWEQFVASAPDAAETVAQCEHCVVIRGTPADASSLDYLRDVVGLITYMTDHGGCIIYDPQMFRWWQPAEWRHELLEPARAVPRRHCVVLVSPEEDRSSKWFHTRGMRKFGRPDISVREVPVELEPGAIDLCHRLIDYQAIGHVIQDGQEIQMASLPAGGVIRHAGNLDDPDFNNVHLDVRLYDAK